MPTTIIKAYANNIYNFPGSPANAKEILIVGTPSTREVVVNYINDNGGLDLFQIIGSWSPFSSTPKTLADLFNSPNFMSGNVSQIIGYSNNILSNTDEYTDITGSIFLASQANSSTSALWQMYGGKNVFYGSTQVPPNSGSDSIYGYPGSNNTYYEFHPTLKYSDKFVGATGSFNKVVLPKTMAQFEIKTNNAIWNDFSQSSSLVGLTISSKDASVNSVDIVNVQRISFTDTNIALDIGPTQNAGSVYMIYKAAFNRAPDASGMGYWLAQKDGGSNIVTNIAQGFVNSAEFTAKYGTNPTNASYVDKLYQNVLGRAGEAGGVAYWNQELDAGRISKAAVLVQFATLAEGASNVASLIAKGIPYTEFVG